MTFQTNPDLEPNRKGLRARRSRAPFIAAIMGAISAVCLALAIGLSLAPTETRAEDASLQPPEGAAIAIFAGGCFWCVEKDFDHVDGVLQTVSGYIGGRTENPTYQSHTADGHLEAVRIAYDPDVVTYDELAHTFLRTVDVTDDGGQFCDRGNSYRTAFFVLDEAQRTSAEEAIELAQAELDRRVVTPVVDATPFWPAEGYHQDFYQKNPLRYQFYRTSCGRDRTVERLWGETAYAGVER